MQNISVAKAGQGRMLPPLFVLTRSVGKSSRFVGILSLSVTDSICFRMAKYKIVKSSGKVEDRKGVQYKIFVRNSVLF